MLTGNLLVSTRRKGRLLPRLLDPAAPGLEAGAAALLELFAACRGRRRGELEEALKDFAPPGVEARVAQGLARLLLDRCTFQAGGAAEPRHLRRELFDGAAEAWRRQGATGIAQWRGALLERVAAGQGLTVQEVESGLYADLAENQLLTELRPISPVQLIYRYNVAQVQGQLLRAQRLTLRSPRPSPQRLRQLFGYLKFFGLLFQVERGTDGELVVVLDGPLSLLESGARYGLNLAQFLPALLHWDLPWRLRAVLTPRPGGPAAELELAPHPLLKSHYPDRGQWVPEEVLHFADEFNALGCGWRVAPAEQVVSLPGNAYLIPDFSFRADDGRPDIMLEYLRYPAREALERRLALIEQNRLAGYVVACRGVPSLQPLAGRCPFVFLFRRSLLPGQVKTFLEGLAGSAAQASLGI